MTSGIQLTDDDDGGIFVDVFPVVAAAPVVITSPGSDPDERELSCDASDVPQHGTPTLLGSSCGNFVVSGLARSRSDVTSQRRFRRRRSAARYLPGLASVSGLYAAAARHGRSCSAIGDTIRRDGSSHPGFCSPDPDVKEQLDNCDGSSSDPSSRQSDPLEMEMTDGCVSEPPVNAAADTDQGRSTARSSLDTTHSSQSVDVAITVEVCDDDDDDSNQVGTRSYRTCLVNIPPVTISSHISPPDDEPADRKCVVAMLSSPTSVLSSSPATQSHLHYNSGSESYRVSRVQLPTH